MTNKCFKGVFQIAGWDEKNWHEGDDESKLSHAQISQIYQGDITGTSQLQYLMSYQDANYAIFSGLELVEATIDGKTGSFVIAHQGNFKNAVASSQFEVLPGSGKDELQGISGSGKFVTGESGSADYEMMLAGF